MFRHLFFFLKKNINKIFKRNIQFYGNYSSWELAKKNSEGYDSKKIFSKSKKSFLKVINKRASYERDSFLFYKNKIT